MAVGTVKVPTFWQMATEVLVRLGYRRTSKEVLNDAVHTFLAANPGARLDVAVELFRDGQVSLERAAELSGLNFWDFKEILKSRGVPVIVEADSPAEIRDMLVASTSVSP